ncbi:YhgE/Pip domain-containing protein [Bacillus sp. FJAT-45037]|uniref:YhgE/Pip domain-containing protein n=1 Tax=Bacillus sp. FJAT-45037 TaxID=2011007 RepID=UPI002FCD937D
MKMKRMSLIALATVIIIPSFLVDAAPDIHSRESAKAEKTIGALSTKEEVVYATMQHDGELDEIYVVNTLIIEESGMIVDYGAYSELKNLTDLSELEQVDDEVQIDAAPSTFYYQGNLEDQRELPWDIDISYLLDGKEIEHEKLAGSNGRLQITIQTSANKNVDPVFFENYIVQLSMTLHHGIYGEIETTDGMIANVGKNKQITFTVMPEQEKEMFVSVDVTDFEFDGIEIAAVPSSMAIDTPDIDEMTGELTSLSDGVKEINDGVAELMAGVSQLNNGVVSLFDGSSQYKQGIGELAGSSTELISASTSINDALSEMSHALQISEDMNVTELKSLPESLLQLTDGLYETADGLALLRENYIQAYDTLDEAMKAIPEHHISEEEIQKLYASGADPVVVDQLIETYSASQQARGTYSAVREGFDAVDATLQEVNVSTKEMGNTLSTIANGLSSSLKNMDGMDSFTQLQQGFAQLSERYGEFHSGLMSYTNGVDQLSGSYEGLHNGIGELSGGTADLESGASELHIGTNTLYKATNNLPAQMQEEVDRMIAEFDKSDFEVVSFVSSKNENVNSVQFVIKTDGIKNEKQEETEEEVVEQKTFWSRLLKLFSRD